MLIALAVATVAALSWGSIAWANEWWAVGVTSLTIVSLAGATLAVAVFGRRAAFCLGFAVLGWMQFGLNHSPWMRDPVGLTLPTTRMVSLLAHRLVPSVPLTYENPFEDLIAVDHDYGADAVVTQAVFTAPEAAATQADHLRYTSIQRIGQSLCVLLLGCIGGWVAKRWTDRASSTLGTAA